MPPFGANVTDSTSDFLHCSTIQRITCTQPHWLKGTCQLHSWISPLFGDERQGHFHKSSGFLSEKNRGTLFTKTSRNHFYFASVCLFGGLAYMGYFVLEVLLSFEFLWLCSEFSFLLLLLTYMPWSPLRYQISACLLFKSDKAGFILWIDLLSFKMWY